MKEKAFQELLQGIREMRLIMAGKRKPSRVFVFDRHGVRKMRKQLTDKDMPVGKLTRVKDFLPSPRKLAMPKSRRAKKRVL